MYTAYPYIVHLIFIKPVDRVIRQGLFIIGNMFKIRELHSLEVKYVDTSSVSSYPKLVVFFKKIKNDIIVEPGILVDKLKSLFPSFE